MNITSEHYPVDWSVIVIARNEEKSIADCLQSVIEAFSGHSYELIFVDSASEDNTVEIARQFPAKIIHLPDNLPKRPSIARETGRLQAKGQWILFIDGDSNLSPGWLDHAEHEKKSNGKLAGIAGIREEFLLTDTDKQTFSYNYKSHASGNNFVNFLGGSAAYKNSVMQEVGGFNPFLYSCEEEEFGARIRKAGYKLKRLPVTMTHHHIKHKKETASEVLRRIRRGFPIGMGQIVRHVQKYELPVKGSLGEISRHLQFYGLLTIGLIALITSAVTGNWLFLAGWLLALVAVFILFAIKSRSLSKPAYYFFEWTVTGPYIIWGLLKKPRQWSDFDMKLLQADTENPPVKIHNEA